MCIRDRKGTRWFKIDHGQASGVLKSVYNHYKRALEMSRKNRHFVKTNFTQEKMTEKLGELSVPSLVIHGEVDPLLPLHCGEATASAIPGAKLLTYPEMGHNLPEIYWPEIIKEILSLC